MLQKRELTLFVGSLFLLSLCMFWLNYDVPFIYDDNNQIKGNSAVHDFFNVKQVLQDDLRPARFIQNWSFALNWSISGSKPWSFHLFNNLLHWANAILLLLLLPLVGVSDKLLRMFTVIVFFVHPLQVEAVTYIMGRIDLLKTFSTLLLLYLYCQEKRRKLVIYMILIISLLVKETCVLTPLMFIMVDLVINSRKIKEINYKEHIFYMSHILWIFPLGYVVRFISYSNEVGFELYPFWQYALANFHYLAYYLFLFFNPGEQSIYHEWVSNPPVVTILVGIVLYGLIFLAIFKFSKNRKSISFFLLFFLFSFLPTQSVLQFINPFAEYRLYQPNIAICFLVGTILMELYENNPKIARLFGLGLILFFGLFHALYIQRWKNPLNLWADAVYNYSTSGMANIGLGYEYGQRGLCKNALRQYEMGCPTITIFNSIWALCYQQWGAQLIASRDIEGAYQHYKKLENDIRFPQEELYKELLILQAATNRHDEYRETLKTARIQFPTKFNDMLDEPPFVQVNPKAKCVANEVVD